MMLSCNEEIFNTIFPNITTIWRRNELNLSIKFTNNPQIPYLINTQSYLVESLKESKNGNYSCLIFEQNGRNWMTSHYRIKRKLKSLFVITILKKHEKKIILTAEFVLIFLCVYLIISNFKFKSFKNYIISLFRLDL